MSMLSHQADELRDRADELRMLASGMDAPYIVPSTKEIMALAMQSAASEMREAADTIESLRDRLQEDGEQTCHATQANYEHCKYSTDRGWRDTSKYAELFGTPERAARTVAEYGKTIYTCDECLLCHDHIGATCEINGDCPWVDGESGYDALLEWLKGGSDG